MKMPSIKTKHRGIVAILDALGAATYEDADIKRFLEARQKASDSLEERLDEMNGRKWDPKQFSFFTFNDTVLMTLRATEEEVSDTEIIYFFRLVRQFFLEALIAGILFRGSCAIGDFLADSQSNTILGEAVSDAAAWYEKAEWIGLLVTPRTTIELKRRQEAAPNKKFACLDYSIPMKGGTSIALKALDWRSLLALDSFKAKTGNIPAREWFLGCLAKQRIPLGTEQKYFNSLAFFDACEAKFGLKPVKAKPKKQGKPTR